MAAAKKANVTNKVKMGSRSKDFFRGVVAEIKKVHWPTKKQLGSYTVVVITTVLLIAVLIWIVDSGLTFVLNAIL